METAMLEMPNLTKTNTNDEVQQEFEPFSTQTKEQSLFEEIDSTNEVDFGDRLKLLQTNGTNGQHLSNGIDMIQDGIENNSVQTHLEGDLDYSQVFDLPPPPPATALSKTSETPSESAPQQPQLQSIQKIMHRQQVVFSDQLRELHSVIQRQKELTGIDPLTNTRVVDNKSGENTKSPESVSIAKNKRGNASGVSSIFEDKLKSLLDKTGGISVVDRVPKFCDLIQKWPQPEEQSLSLTVLLGSKDVCWKKFVETDGLRILNGWLLQYIKDGKLTNIKLLLKVLRILPVTIDTLRTSAIGKTVNKLKNFPDEDIVRRANKLVKRWMTLLNSAAEQQVKEGAKKSTSAKSTKVDVATADKKEKAPAKKQVQVLVASDDLDAQLAQPTAKATGGKPSLAPDHIKPKKHKMQLLEQPETSAPKKPVPKPVYSSKPLSADEVRKQKFKEKVLNAPSSQGGVDQLTAATATTTATSTAESTEPPAKKLKTRSPLDEIDVAGFAATSSPPLSTSVGGWDLTMDDAPAASVSDAGASASNVSRRTGKPKKRVSWAPPEKLEAVKEFVKEEPLQEDSAASAAAAAGTAVSHATNGSKELNKELSKRERDLIALRSRKKLEEDQFDNKFQAFQPVLEWKTPPVMRLSEEFVVNRGSESKQASLQAERETKVLSAVYFSEDQIPDTPDESELLAQATSPSDDYDDSKLTIIPLEELIDTAAQNVPSQQPTSSFSLANPPASVPSSTAPTPSGAVAPDQLALLSSLLQQINQRNPTTPGSGPGPGPGPYTGPPSGMGNLPSSSSAQAPMGHGGGFPPGPFGGNSNMGPGQGGFPGPGGSMPMHPSNLINSTNNPSLPPQHQQGMNIGLGGMFTPHPSSMQPQQQPQQHLPFGAQFHNAPPPSQQHHHHPAGMIHQSGTPVPPNNMPFQLLSNNAAPTPGGGGGGGMFSGAPLPFGSYPAHSQPQSQLPPGFHQSFGGMLMPNAMIPPQPHPQQQPGFPSDMLPPEQRFFPTAGGIPPAGNQQPHFRERDRERERERYDDRFDRERRSDGRDHSRGGGRERYDDGGSGRSHERHDGSGGGRGRGGAGSGGPRKRFNIVCNFFNTEVGCRNGDDCPYIHDPSIKRSRS